MAVRAAAAAAVALLVHAAAAQRQPIYHWWPTTSQSQDPSGVLQTSDGRWHVFPDCAGAPYNFSLPYTSGLMWCHFSSLDLVHWDEHPPALAPNSAAASADVFTGSIVRLPNGSHWAIFATVNKSSHNTTNPQHPRGTFCTGNIASAISHDPLLETWEQQGTVIDNAMGTPNAPPGVDANFCTLQDPTTPWLGACSAPAAPGAQCWNVVLGSGNNNASSPNFGNLGLLYRTRSATDLRHWHYVSVLFKSAHTPYFGPVRRRLAARARAPRPESPAAPAWRALSRSRAAPRRATSSPAPISSSWRAIPTSSRPRRIPTPTGGLGHTTSPRRASSPRPRRRAIAR
jgi:hypothetical protein